MGIPPIPGHGSGRTVRNVDDEGGPELSGVRGRRRAGFLTLLAFIIGAATAGLASASEGLQHGYWWKLRQPGLIAPAPPPHVPSDGLWVALDPDGHHAISALRLPPSDRPVRSVTLSASDTSGTPELQACPVATDWEPAEAGEWAFRPEVDCAAAAAGTPSDDGSSWTFDLSAWPQLPEFGVALVPATASGLYSVAFEPPSVDAFTFAPPPRPRTEPARPEPAAPAPAPPAPQAPAPAGPTVPAPSSRVAPVLPPIAQAPSAPTTAPAPVPAPEVAPAASSDTAAPSQPNTASTVASAQALPDSERRWLLVVAALLVTYLWVWRSRIAVARSIDHPLARGRDVDLARPDALLLSANGEAAR